MSKKFTWGQLQQFCNALPEEKLNEPVKVLIDCHERYEFVEAMFTEALYVNVNDYEDAWPEADFLREKELGYIENPEDYKFYPAGRPFLTDECNGEGWDKVVLPESENTADNPY